MTLSVCGGTAKATILVVDDDRFVRQSLVRAIMRLHYRPLIAADGVEALVILARETIDLVLVDVHMPTMDGIQLLRHMQQAGSSIPVIVMSGGGTLPRSVALEVGDLLGASTTMSKPITAAELASKIATLLVRGPR